MDTRLPMMVQSPDFAGSMMNGLNAGGMARQAGQQNALANLYQTQGPQIMAGDPGALNALARMDPTAAMGVQQNQLGMQATRLGMEQTQMQMQAIRDNAKAQAAEAAAGLDAAKVAAEIDQTKRTMAGAAPLLMAWKQNNDPAAAQALIAYLGRNGVPVTLETLEPTIYAMQGGLEGLTDGLSALEKMQGLMPEVPQAADEYQRYVQEEAAAGRRPLSRIEFSAANRAPPSALSVVTSPDGTQTVTQGPTGATPAGTMDIDPREIDTVTQAIDAIANDPALNKVVGPLEGGGGNNVDDLGATARMYYGGDGLALIQRINQLQSTTWLAARQMLKGGGAITDYEAKKAEAAMSRLSRAQGEPEFKAALKDLRDAVTEGRAKLQAAQGGQPAQTGPATPSASPQEIGAMTLDQVIMVDLNTLDDAGKDALEKRLNELGF